MSLRQRYTSADLLSLKVQVGGAVSTGVCVCVYGTWEMRAQALNGVLW